MEHIILFLAYPICFPSRLTFCVVSSILSSGFFHRLSINHNTSTADQFFDFTSGSLPHLGKIFVYAHHAD